MGVYVLRSTSSFTLRMNSVEIEIILNTGVRLGGVMIMNGWGRMEKMLSVSMTAEHKVLLEHRNGQIVNNLQQDPVYVSGVFS